MSEPEPKEKLSEMIAKMRGHYGPETIPPCPVCKGPRNSICASGMGRVTYCCSSPDAEPMGKGDRYEECMQHFSRSRWETVPGDSRVIRLIGAFEELQTAARRVTEARDNGGDVGGAIEWLEAVLLDGEEGA